MFSHNCCMVSQNFWWSNNPYFRAEGDYQPQPGKGALRVYNPSDSWDDWHHYEVLRNGQFSSYGEIFIPRQRGNYIIGRVGDIVKMGACTFELKTNPDTTTSYEIQDLC